MDKNQLPRWFCLSDCGYKIPGAIELQTGPVRLAGSVLISSCQYPCLFQAACSKEILGKAHDLVVERLETAPSMMLLIFHKRLI